MGAIYIYIYIYIRGAKASSADQFITFFSHFRVFILYIKSSVINIQDAFLL